MPCQCSTRAMTSCPGTMGSFGGGGVRPSISSSSVWQTPQTETRSSNSLSLGSGIGRSTSSSGSSWSVREHVWRRIMAFIVSPLSDRRSTSHDSAETRRRATSAIFAFSRLERSCSSRNASGSGNPLLFISSPFACSTTLRSCNACSSDAAC